MGSENRVLSQRVILIIGLGSIAVFVAGLFLAIGKTTYDTWGGLIIGPILVALSIPILSRIAQKEEDRSLFWLLLAALLLRLIIGTVGRLYVAFSLYGGRADVTDFLKHGTDIAYNFRHGVFTTGLNNYSDTNFIRLLTGIVLAVIGPTRLGAYMVFAWLPFWGQVLFYRAFRIAVPEGRGRTYARLMLLLPSMIFWPSAIGKEAWMVFALGIGAYGAARALTGWTFRGLMLVGVGLWFAQFLRPHVAAMLGLGLGVAYLFRKPRAELRELAPLVKGLGLAVMAALAIVLLIATQSYLKGSFVKSGINSGTLNQTATITSQEGKSEYTAPVVTNPKNIPIAIITVLYRPLPIEAKNAQALVAAMEGGFLLVLTLVRFRWLLAALKSLRRRPYVALAVTFTAIFIGAFSAVANFGLLARERVQLFPFALILLSIPPRGKRLEETDAEVTDHPALEPHAMDR